MRASSLGPSRPLRRTTVLIGAIVVAMAAVLVTRPGGAARLRAVDDLLQVVGPLVVLSLALRGLPRQWRRDRSGALSPLFIGLAVICNGVGQLIWAYDEIVRGQLTPFPSTADVAFLLAYPCLLIGILALRDPRQSFIVRTRDLLDTLTVMAGAMTFSWYFLLAPTLLQAGAGPLGKLVGLAYPVGDLIVVACILQLLAHDTQRELRSAVGVAAAAMAVIVLTDSVFSFQTLHGTYATGGFVDLGWPLGDMLLALSAQAILLATARTPRGSIDAPVEPGPVDLWRALMPYVPLPFVTLLVLWVWFGTRRGLPEQGLAIGAVTLVVLVVTRQVLTILENRRLHAAASLYARRLEAANARLEELATTDLLTELPNHRGLATVLDRELERARRVGHPLSLLFVDLDHFKAINDVYGHVAGDTVLAEFGRITRMSLRAVDVVGRWGGEEFLAVLPECDGDDAVAAAERVRAAVTRHAFDLGGGLHLTCCVGVACYPADATEREDLLTLADQALYSAKQLGRDQVRSARDVRSAGPAGEPREIQALTGTVEALAATVAARDAGAAGTADEMSTLVLDLALAMGMESGQAQVLALVARLHDLGKVAIPDAILLKPAHLAADELAIVRSHPEVGAAILARVPELRALGPLIRAHHERWDGTGYPDGLAGDAIPLGARILAVADAFVALTSERPYRAARGRDDGLALLQAAAGTQFDPAVVAALTRVLGREPRATRAILRSLIPITD
ncbi:MAG TPA: diguanylate cyclase [Thermomicrobiaceae bacterium]|nr:diguanylate cyclase [Thermomicrobiaceae bacterium]